MAKYIFKKIGILMCSLIGISIVVFYLINLQPGNPYTDMINPNLSPDVIREKLEKIGYYDPLYLRYFKWLRNVITGDFGYSIHFSKPVLAVIMNRLPYTILLSFITLFFTLIISLLFGFISSIKKNKFIDNVISVFSTVGVSIPSFFLGLIFIKIFAYDLNIFPASGFVDSRISREDSGYYINILSHIALPVMVLSIVQSSAFIKYIRSAFIEVASSEYITYAMAKGLSRNKAIFRHGIKNIIAPIITIFCMQIPILFSGSLVTETIFVWPGVGRLGYEAVQNRDYPLIMGILLISSILILLSNLLSDILYKIVNKRIKY